jgi:U3 small nucleolar RNA-associated protein 10
MEEVILCGVYARDKKRDVCTDITKEVRDFANTILKTITGWMRASTYLMGITLLLDHSDNHVKRKVLVG